MRKPAMAARRSAWALARFLHRNHRPDEKEKNVLAGCQLRLLVPKSHIPNASCPLDKAFFSFSPALRTHGAQKRAKAHARKSISRQTTGFLRTLRLPTPLLCFWWHRLSSLCVAGRDAPPTCHLWKRTVVCGRAVSARDQPNRRHRPSSLCPLILKTADEHRPTKMRFRVLRVSSWICLLAPTAQAAPRGGGWLGRPGTTEAKAPAAGDGGAGQRPLPPGPPSVVLAGPACGAGHPPRSRPGGQPPESRTAALACFPGSRRATSLRP